MKLRMLVVLLTAVCLAGLSACGGDNQQEVDRHRTATVIAGFTKTPTVPATVTPTGVPTGTVATRTPGGPTPTPCSGANPICGNGACEAGEQCDDGSICLPDPSSDLEPTYQNCSATGLCPAGETCEPVGGDGCASNCTLEARRIANLDPERSGAIVHFGPTGAGIVELSLSGQQVLTTGDARDEVVVGPNGIELAQPGEVPIIIKAADVGFDPASVGILVCACINGVEVPSYGPGLSGRGFTGCGENGLTDINVMIEVDHNTTPGSPGNSGPANGLPDDPDCDLFAENIDGFISEACFEGQGEACSEPRYSHSVCNSPTIITFSGGPAPRGSTSFTANTAIALLTDGGACDLTIAGMDPCPFADYGPDCVPCTADDLQKGNPSLNVTTSGTSTSVIYNATNVASGLNRQTVGPGQPTNCDAILGNPDAPLAGVLVTSFPGIDTAQIGDSVTETTLASQ